MLKDRIIAEKLEACSGTAAGKKAWIGFDGFIDELFKVVETRQSPTACTYFPTIARFARRIADAAGKSADIELVSQDLRLGGNAPIMANALAGLGVDTVCIGAMGHPERHPAFDAMSDRCRCISVCDPAITYAYEFNDGKLMFADHHSLNSLDWTYLKSKLSISDLLQLAVDSDLWGFVNWSVMSGADSIWRGFCREVLPLISPELLREKTVFFDLADPAKREREDILGILKLISQFGQCCHAILGLNENEALRVFSALCPQQQSDCCSLELKTKEISSILQVDAVIVHPTDCCLVANGSDVKTEPGVLVKEPVITTGGGDNFNAGFCMARLLGLNFEECARTAMAVSGFYVSNGHSPSMEELISFMKAI